MCIYVYTYVYIYMCIIIVDIIFHTAFSMDMQVIFRSVAGDMLWVLASNSNLDLFFFVEKHTHTPFMIRFSIININISVGNILVRIIELLNI